MPPTTITIFPNYNFGVSYELDEHPHNIEFALHNHNDVYEIVLLLNGDCEFFVEGNIYISCIKMI